MTTIKVKQGGSKGTVTLKDGVLTVDAPDKLAAALHEFFTTEREFYLPQSAFIDHYKVVRDKPTASDLFFDLAACELMVNTGIEVTDFGGDN